MSNSQTPQTLFAADQVWDSRDYVLGAVVAVPEGCTIARVVLDAPAQVFLIPLTKGYGASAPAHAQMEKIPTWGSAGMWYFGGTEPDAAITTKFTFLFPVAGASWFSMALKATATAGAVNASVEFGRWRSEIPAPPQTVMNVQGTVDAVIPAYAQPISVILEGS